MELTHQQKLVAAAMNAKGCTIDEIVAKVDADRDVIEEFVSGRNIKREKAEELRAKGMRAKDIAEALNVSQKTIYTWTNKAKKEPAPAEAETSPKEKYLQEYNTSVSRKSQAEAIANLFYQAERACKSMIYTYDNMTCEEQRAFDMGEAYCDMLSVRNDLERLLMKAGEQA